MRSAAVDAVNLSTEQEVGAAFQINTLSLAAVNHELLSQATVCVCAQEQVKGSKVTHPPLLPTLSLIYELTHSSGGGCHYHRNAQHVLRGRDPYHQTV